MIDMSDYTQPVHRSLLPREMIAGVPQAGLFIIFISGLIFIYALGWYFMIVPIAIGYFYMRYLTGKDQWSIDIGIANMLQKDVYLP